MTGVRRELQQGNLALPALGVVLALAAGYLWVMTDGTVYFYDEWAFLYRRLGAPAETLLNHHNGSLNLVPLLLYQSVFGAFGLDDYWVLRVLTIVFVVLCSLLLFLYLRPRVAPWVAFWPAAFLPFFGAAYWVQTTSLGLLWTIPMAAGLGALLALDRRALGADLAAGALLVVAVASHTPGLIFVAGAVAAVSLRPPPERWSRAWIWALPLVLYAAWVHQYGDDGSTDLSKIVTLPKVALESMSTVLGGIVGLYSKPDEVGAARDAIETDLMVPISLALTVLVVVLAVLRRLPRETLVGIAMALSLWAIIAVATGEGRTPTESRYLHVAAAVVLISLAFLLPRARLPAYVPIVVGAVFLAGLASNLRALSAGADSVMLSSRWQAAGATGVELAGGRPEPSLPTGHPVGHVEEGYLPSSSRSYLDLIEEYGSPALSVDELRSSDPITRRVADQVLARVLDLQLKPRPAVSISAPARRTCARLKAGSKRAMNRPPGSETIVMADPGGKATVRIGRYGDDAVVPLGTVPAGKAALLSIPRDRAREPWRIDARSDHGVAVCGRSRL